jgi:hypothetical protein
VGVRYLKINLVHTILIVNEGGNFGEYCLHYPVKEKQSRISKEYIKHTLFGSVKDFFILDEISKYVNKFISKYHPTYSSKYHQNMNIFLIDASRYSES